MSTAISLSIQHPPLGIIAANHTPLLKTQVLEGKLYKPDSGARRKIISSSSPTPTTVGHSSPARRVRISEPSPHDDYLSRLENLQQRLGWMDSVLQGLGYFHGDRREIQRLCQDFAVLVTLFDLDLHWLHTL
uniref:Uncharacterized protein n=1 Tax=Magallana gigas TaxID=29159 RepID=K1P1C3_MAGGI